MKYFFPVWTSNTSKDPKIKYRNKYRNKFCTPFVHLYRERMIDEVSGRIWGNNLPFLVYASSEFWVICCSTLLGQSAGVYNPHPRLMNTFSSRSTAFPPQILLLSSTPAPGGAVCWWKLICWIDGGSPASDGVNVLMLFSALTVKFL